MSSRKIALSLATLVVSITSALYAAEDERPIVNDAGKPQEKAVNAALPTLWIIGDSTVNSGGGQMRGWGQEIGTFFDRSKINVVNRAIGGRSSRTFRAEGRWDKVLNEIKKGDFLLVQFGHNDGGPIGDASKHRGSLKGLGEETEEDTKTDGSKETVHTFGWYMRQYASEAKAKGASVILLSPVPHKNWKGDFTDQRKWAQTAAESGGGNFIDLTAIVSAVYEKEGAEKVETFFADPRTHTNAEGAQVNARSVVAGLRGLPGKPFEGFLSAEGRGIEPAK